MKRARYLAAALLLATAACSQQEEDRQCAVLTGGGNYCLQPTTAVGVFDLQQKVDSRFRDRHDTLIVEIEVDATGMRFAGLTPFGQKLIQLEYDNREARATMVADSRINPTLLIALLQLALWPADTVRAGLEAPLVLEENAHQRRILKHGEPIITIAHDGGQVPWRKVNMTVHAADLELTIETLNAAPAAANSR
jgi:hypothetical protein